MEDNCLNCKSYREVSMLESKKLRIKDIDAKFGTCFQPNSTMVYLELEYIQDTQAFEDCPSFKKKEL